VGAIREIYNYKLSPICPTDIFPMTYSEELGQLLEKHQKFCYNNNMFMKEREEK